ncbi:MAG: hypothetical protein IH597_13785 [Bacteroidales bacterium]|nr:hypothetical protein [Bacteroidales bacterium]
MRFLKEIRLKIGLYFLRKHAGKIIRDKKTIAFEEITSFVLFFETNEARVPQAIEQFSQMLVKENKKVFQVVYFTGDLNRLEYGPHDKRIILTKKDLNLFLIPSKEILESFEYIAAEYLVDLNLTDCFPLLYLAAISSAHLKAGIQSDLRFPWYDLMIKDESNDQQEFTQHLLHYIKILNPH